MLSIDVEKRGAFAFFFLKSYFERRMYFIELHQIFIGLFFTSKRRKGIIYISEIKGRFSYFREHLCWITRRKASLLNTTKKSFSRKHPNLPSISNTPRRIMKLVLHTRLNCGNNRRIWLTKSSIETRDLCSLLSRCYSCASTPI